MHRRDLIVGLGGLGAAALLPKRLAHANGAARLQTTTLGLSLRQNGVLAPLTHIDAPAPLSASAASLKPAPFEIIVPAAKWAERSYRNIFHLGITKDDKIWRLIRLNAPDMDSGFLMSEGFKVMAYSPDTPGEMLTSEHMINGRPDYASNGLHEEERAVRDTAGNLAFKVTDIQDRDNFDSLVKANSVVHLAFYLDCALGDSPTIYSPELSEMRDRVDAREIDLLRIDFT